MSERYSDGVLDEKFVGIEDKMDAHFEVQNKSLIRIETQTTRTNGRVTFLEKMVWGAMFLLPVLVGECGWLTIDYLNHRDATATPDQIQAAVASGIDQALQQYNK